MVSFTKIHAALEDAVPLLAQDRPPFVRALLRQLCALLRGRRDAALADDPELHYMSAVELRLLLEQFQREGI